MDVVHEKIHHGKKLYCNGVVPLTPEKKNNDQADLSEESASIAVPSIALSTEGSSKSTQSNHPGVTKSSSYITAREAFEHLDDSLSQQPCGNTLARRHSISLNGRTPPRNSLASELLETTATRPDFQKTRSIVTEVKELSDRLSEFSSCVSNQDSSENDSQDEREIIGSYLKTPTLEKRRKKNKRKLKVTPDKEFFLKKPNLSNK